MNRHRIVVPVVLAIGLLCLSAPVGATPIMVLNSSFEGPDTDTYLIGTIDDWTLSGTSAGVFDPAGCAGVCSSPGPYFVSGNTVPDGMQTAFSNGPEIHQVLGDVLTAGTTYTLEAYVGDRYDNLLPSHEIQLWAGANLLATNSGAPGDGEFVNVVATYTATGASPGLAEPLSIWLVCIAPGFLDSGLTVFAPTLPRPAVRGRVAPGLGFDSGTSPASTARCTSA